ncbi:MAG: hypothetical protein QF785_00935 [Phycisphaeraceae bacterium]|jgi:YHS domain-containing protein|nr:hypothetical protein [Phycisphaeraceae bacterium]MDP7346927.1 hypothetical protein [Phycisphaeraceae bacterium]
MIRRYLTIGICILAVCGFGCGEDRPSQDHSGHDHAPGEHPDKSSTSQPTDAGATSKPTAMNVVNAICPVSGHAVKEGGGMFEFAGKNIGFCCDDCIEEFKKAPAKYAAKLE